MNNLGIARKKKSYNIQRYTIVRGMGVWVYGVQVTVITVRAFPEVLRYERSKVVDQSRGAMSGVTRMLVAQASSSSSSSSSSSITSSITLPS